MVQRTLYYIKLCHAFQITLQADRSLFAPRPKSPPPKATPPSPAHHSPISVSSIDVQYIQVHIGQWNPALQTALKYGRLQ